MTDLDLGEWPRGKKRNRTKRKCQQGNQTPPSLPRSRSGSATEINYFLIIFCPLYCTSNPEVICCSNKFPLDFPEIIIKERHLWWHDSKNSIIFGISGRFQRQFTHHMPPVPEFAVSSAMLIIEHLLLSFVNLINVEVVDKRYQKENEKRNVKGSNEKLKPLLQWACVLLAVSLRY